METQGGYLRVLRYNTDPKPTVFARLSPEHVVHAAELVEAVNLDRLSFKPPWYNASIDFVPVQGMKLADRLRSETELNQANKWATSCNWLEHYREDVWDATRSLREAVTRCLTILDSTNAAPTPTPTHALREPKWIPSPIQSAVLELLRTLPAGQGLTGPQIVERLAQANPPTDVDPGTISRHIIPELKRHAGVKNERRRGYYIDRA